MKRLSLVAALVACKDNAAQKAPPAPPPDLAGSATGDAATAAAGPWPELAKLPVIDAVRVITLPAKTSAPRFTVGGPVLAGGLAVVSSSQFGFIAVDYKTGQIVWTKPAGAHVAPPLAIDGNFVLIGDCVTAPDVSDADTLLGCARVVTAVGQDQAYVAIHAKQDAVAEFAGSDGLQAVFRDRDEAIWRRGAKAVSIDLLSGVAKPAPAEDPPLVVTYKDKTWQVRRTEEGLIKAEGKPPWTTESSYGALLGAVYIPDQSPLVRVSQPTRRYEHPELMMFDIDATGSLHGQVSLNPAPGIGLLGHAIDSVGNVALAVRLDTSLEREYIAGYAANASLIWVYPLPQVKRADPIGIAVAPDAVVVFHDGDTLTVLPELSAPPTAPGAVRAPSENTTP
ncbi:MAG TPA: hypothetical protein VL326_10170 [Kofleriaceae bacterium]|nr:hypothetical protein [Kofleriaceae bacterium]